MDNSVSSDVLLAANQVLRTGGVALGIDLDEGKRANFTKYLEMLYEWNEKINLTRIAPSDAAILHFLDSLLIFSVVELAAGSYVIDIGCGAGLPGLCIAIARPDLHVTLIDGTRKKIVFVQHVIDTLNLSNARALHARAESLALEDAHRHAYDCVVARAVADLELLSTLFAPLLRPGGVGVAFKGPEVVKEMKGVSKIQAKTGLNVDVRAIAIPGTDIERQMVRFTHRSKAR